jgi:hypothetical protein
MARKLRLDLEIRLDRSHPLAIDRLHVLWASRERRQQIDLDPEHQPINNMPPRWPEIEKARQGRGNIQEKIE